MLIMQWGSKIISNGVANQEDPSTRSMRPEMAL